jgi:hypothetical protein
MRLQACRTGIDIISPSEGSLIVYGRAVLAWTIDCLPLANGDRVIVQLDGNTVANLSVRCRVRQMSLLLAEFDTKDALGWFLHAQALTGARKIHMMGAYIGVHVASVALFSADGQRRAISFVRYLSARERWSEEMQELSILREVVHKTCYFGMLLFFA